MTIGYDDYFIDLTDRFCIEEIQRDAKKLAEESDDVNLSNLYLQLDSILERIIVIIHS